MRWFMDACCFTFIVPCGNHGVHWCIRTVETFESNAAFLSMSYLTGWRLKFHVPWLFHVFFYVFLCMTQGWDVFGLHRLGTVFRRGQAKWQQLHLEKGVTRSEQSPSEFYKLAWWISDDFLVNASWTHDNTYYFNAAQSIQNVKLRWNSWTCVSPTGL